MSMALFKVGEKVCHQKPGFKFGIASEVLEVLENGEDWAYIVGSDRLCLTQVQLLDWNPYGSARGNSEYSASDVVVMFSRNRIQLATIASVRWCRGGGTWFYKVWWTDSKVKYEEISGDYLTSLKKLMAPFYLEVNGNFILTGGNNGES